MYICMAILKAWLLVVALAMVVVAAEFDVDEIEPWGSGTCNGLVGECIGGEEEMMMESEASRRVLANRRRAAGFVSYGALEKDKVPCNRRGHSYYNCRRRGKANPYRRACSVITKCKRFTN